MSELMKPSVASLLQDCFDLAKACFDGHCLARVVCH
jgi:hypothetical protein